LRKRKTNASSLQPQFVRQEFSESFSRSALLTIRILDNLPDSFRRKRNLRSQCETTFSRGNSRRSQVRAYSYSPYILHNISKNET